ncbi:MAG TPA: multifunctional CCA addition/repair protein [Trinickia sp.]|uniref:multifunctional CCA addition/repair protein n=1 Tax=Trinickia sp. TaxID=2571163 RepID=UPI002F412F14
MKIYAVGGAIRDELLGVPVSDRDYVVVGATPEQMVAQGYRPVGKDFPVFLHPATQEEYALARTERKTAAGYHGFQFYYAPDVTLEEDLARRDLTINAMAREVRPDGELTGPVIDPFDGQRDLAEKRFRHVGEAFVEDPVRILRLARFAARFHDFDVAPDTLALMKTMVAAGEVDALVPERVWQEISRGLMENKPSRMFAALRDCGALARVLPEVDALFGVAQRADYHPEVDTGVHVMMVVDYAAARGYALAVRFAALTHDLGKATTPADVLPRHVGHEMRSVDLLRPMCERLRVPNECRDLALLVAREHGNIHRVMDMGAAALVRLLERSDALRKPARFAEALQACESDARGRLGFEMREYPQAERLRVALVAARAVDAGAIAQAQAQQGQGQAQEGKPAGAEKIKEAVHRARVAAVAAALGQAPDALSEDAGAS